MVESITLIDEVRLALAQSLRALRLSQSQWGKRSNVSPAVVSNLLTGKAPVREADRVSRLCGTMLQQLGEQKAKGLMKEDEVRSTEAAVEILRDVFHIAGATLISPPGAPVPATAINYIPRREEKRVREILRTPPFTLLLKGPPDSGKTTLLLALGSAAQNEGYRVSMQDAVLWGEDRPTPLLFESLLRGLKEDWDLGDALSLEDEALKAPVNTLVSALAWVDGQASRPERGYLLVLDDITRLALPVLQRVGNFIRVLDNARKGKGLRVSVAVEAGPRAMVDDYISELSAVMKATVETIEWFTRNDVQSLMGTLRKEPSHAEALWNLFQGQPLLTHQAAWLLDDTTSADKVEEWAMEGREGFRRHLHRLADVVGQPDSPAYDLMATMVASSTPQEQPIMGVRRLSDARLIKRTSAPLGSGSKAAFFEVGSRYYREVWPLVQELCKEASSVRPAAGHIAV